MRTSEHKLETQPEQTGSATAAGSLAGQGPSQRQFLHEFFRLLEEHRIRYCVLQPFERLPEAVEGELELAIHPRDWGKLWRVFSTLVECGYHPSQCRHYAAGGMRFDFVWYGPEGVKTVGLDVCKGFREKGLILMSGDEFVAQRRPFNGIWVADPSVEFRYLLVKQTLRGTLPPPQAARLKSLFADIGQQRALGIAGELFGEGRQEAVVEALGKDSLGGLLEGLGKPLRRTLLRKDPLNSVRYHLADVPRLIGRWFRPTGLFLVVLGPDGVGKSTIIGRLIAALSTVGFARYRIFHWRPNVIRGRKGKSGPATDPHDEPPRGRLGSLAALLVAFLDYWLAYVLFMRSFLARSGLVLFDRYYHDLLVDPLRYRYGGPLSVARFLGRFVPPPDLVFIVLDADEQTILARKSEVPPEELRRQRTSYRAFTMNNEKAALVRTDRKIEDAVDDSTRVIVDYLTQRFQRRHERWLTPNT
jgi:thymidylate kinase